MQTITLRERIGEDGVLRLQMPVEPRGGEVEVVVVIQPSVEAHSNGNGATAEHNAWVDKFHRSLRDETFEIPEELPWGEDRVILE